MATMSYLLQLSGLVRGLPEAPGVIIATLLSIITLLALLLLAGLSYIKQSDLSEGLLNQLASAQAREVYRDIIQPSQGQVIWIVIAAILDLFLLFNAVTGWLNIFEFLLSIAIAISIVNFGFKALSRFFDTYILGVTLEDESKINVELVTLAQFLAKTTLTLVIISIFAEVHRINIIGLVASLGVGGVAVAFASQKVIEQVLWSIVIYIDRPFTVGDYIHLPDRTLGRVESIGWRSTKVRLSGKNTLAVIPNSNLAQVNIENLSRAQRVISMLNLKFLRLMSEDEMALIEQLILDSTADILGIDQQLTKVSFQEVVNESGQINIQAQVIFFILGTTESAMELRKGLLEIARDNIIKRLNNYGIAFKFESSIVDVTQPMNI
jgi:MscS family membrane protein